MGPEQDQQETSAEPAGDAEKVTYGGDDDVHDYVDRSKIDFDPEDGLYSGTAVTGDSEIPDPGDVDAQAAGEEPPGDGPPDG